MLLFACWKLGKGLGNFEKFCIITSYIHIENNFGEKQQGFPRHCQGHAIELIEKTAFKLAWMILFGT